MLSELDALNAFQLTVSLSDKMRKANLGYGVTGFSKLILKQFQFISQKETSISIFFKKKKSQILLVSTLLNARDTK